MNGLTGAGLVLQNNGGNDVGIAWQLLASLKRVAYGYSLAVVAGVSLGVDAMLSALLGPSLDRLSTP